MNLVFTTVLDFCGDWDTSAIVRLAEENRMLIMQMGRLADGQDCWHFPTPSTTLGLCFAEGSLAGDSREVASMIGQPLGTRALLLSCCGLLAGLMPCATARQPRPTENDKSLFARDNLVAWCIVPFDAKKRGPEERAAMLKRLGFTRFAYDWRAEHIPMPRCSGLAPTKGFQHALPFRRG